MGIMSIEWEEPEANWEGNWGCSLSEGSRCRFASDYLSLLEVAKSVTRNSSNVFVVIPPPIHVQRHGWGYYNGKKWMPVQEPRVVNQVLPVLLPQIASVAGLPAPIDAFSQLGGQDIALHDELFECLRSTGVGAPYDCRYFCEDGSTLSPCDGIHVSGSGARQIALAVHSAIMNGTTCTAI